MNATPASPSFRILVIDDTPTIHDDFRKILCPAPRGEAGGVEDLADAIFGASISAHERPKFRVDSAMQGEEGLGLLRVAAAGGDPYAVAFVDMRMPPGWNGVETIRHLWSEDPGLQVVICTAYADTAWDETLRQLGDPDNLLVLKKPFDSIEALQLARALSQKWWAARRSQPSSAR